MRGACGANTHPDPKQFIQVYRLLSTASLIKPPRGSNVTGGEMLQSLTSYSDVLAKADENYIEVVEKPQEEHCYNQNRRINAFGFQMFGGYVARKVRAMSSAKSCDACFKSLTLAPCSC